MDALWTRDDSIVNIYGGDLGILSAADDSSVSLYAYDVIYYPTGGYYDHGWVEGKYFANDLYFDFDFGGSDTFSHITVVPEPTSVLLFAFGGLFLRNRSLQQLARNCV